MDIDKIMELIDKVDASGISCLTVEEGCLKICIEKAKGQAVVTEGGSIIAVPEKNPDPIKTEPSERVYITAPIVGVFYSSPSPDSQAFVKPGDRVSKGQVVGIIEAMKLMNDIESDVDGIIEDVLVTNSHSVEYGQPLFTVAITE